MIEDSVDSLNGTGRKLVVVTVKARIRTLVHDETSVGRVGWDTERILRVIVIAAPGVANL